MSEDKQAALLEIRAAKSKLQKQLRALQTREWELMDEIAKPRQVKRTLDPGEVSVERSLSHSELIGLSRVTRSRENVFTDFNNLD